MRIPINLQVAGFLAASAVALAAGSIHDQSSTTKTSTTQSETYRGCVQRVGGKYILTDATKSPGTIGISSGTAGASAGPAGTSGAAKSPESVGYELVAGQSADIKFSEYDGQLVEVSGSIDAQTSTARSTTPRDTTSSSVAAAQPVGGVGVRPSGRFIVSSILRVSSGCASSP